MKHICIDARFYGISHTGIGRYTQELIKNIPHNNDIKVSLVINKDNNDEFINQFDVYKTRHHPYTLMSQFEMLKILLKAKPDILHIPHFTIPVFWTGKTIVTIHDLIKHKVKGRSTTTKNKFIYWPKYFGYRIIVSLALQRALHIITPSNYWKNILINEFKIKSDKITVTYEGVDSSFFINKSSKTNNNLVYTGNLYPHKNVGLAIKAAEKLKIKIFVICARSIFQNRLIESKYVRFLGELSDTEIRKIYSESLAFIFPSFYEGFGLPGLEAMAAGLPVISSNASCLPEIYKDCALYFNPNNLEELIEKIELIQSDKNLRNELVNKGRKLARSYTWDKMGKETWQIYLSKLQ